MATTNLLTGSISKGMLSFAFPLMLGNILQQFYNLADTFIVGRFIGSGALAAVGASYALMVFLNSIQFGLCLGCGTLFSIHYGSRNMPLLRKNVCASFLLIAAVTVFMNIAVFLLIDPLMHLLQVPPDIYRIMREYLWIVFWGIGMTFIYNFFASFLRAIGDSLTPLLALALAVALNILLDILFVCSLDYGIAGAAWATVISQSVSALGIGIYTFISHNKLFPRKKDMRISRHTFREITAFSSLTCLQQSVMNFGILLVQGLVNSFGTTVMAAFAAAVKIDTLAYMPAQDFGNAFSTFIAQNFGANRQDRIKKGIRTAVRITALFCIPVSALIFLFAEPLIRIFVNAGESEIIEIGARYLRTEGSFYCGIGLLFLFYGYFRAIKKPSVSVILTVVSLGSRVLLAYTLSSLPHFGTSGIWWSVPIGWILADAVGFLYYRRYRPAASRCGTTPL